MPEIQRTVFGVGYNSNGIPVTHKGKLLPAYRAWTNMLMRVYDEATRYKHPQYLTVTVCPEWQDFTMFNSWFETEQNSGVPGMHLDKDLRKPGSAEYGPDTCAFIPNQINTLLNDCPGRRGDLPAGVTAYGKRFRAKISIRGKCEHLGLFATPGQAHSVYCAAKQAHVRSMAVYWQAELHPEIYTRLSTYGLA